MYFIGLPISIRLTPFPPITLFSYELFLNLTLAAEQQTSPLLSDFFSVHSIFGSDSFQSFESLVNFGLKTERQFKIFSLKSWIFFREIKKKEKFNESGVKKYFTLAWISM